MKITKLSQNLQDESTKPVTGPSHTAEIMKKMDPIFDRRISSWYIADGSVGWFLYNDGNEYEVVVTPAKYGKYKNLRENEDWWKRTDEAKNQVKALRDSGNITEEQFQARMKELEANSTLIMSKTSQTENPDLMKMDAYCDKRIKMYEQVIILHSEWMERYKLELGPINRVMELTEEKLKKAEALENSLTPSISAKIAKIRQLTEKIRSILG